MSRRKTPPRARDTVRGNSVLSVLFRVSVLRGGAVVFVFSVFPTSRSTGREEISSGKEISYRQTDLNTFTVIREDEACISHISDVSTLSPLCPCLSSWLTTCASVFPL